jgi:hypothetical protein
MPININLKMMSVVNLSGRDWIVLSPVVIWKMSVQHSIHPAQIRGDESLARTLAMQFLLN